MPLVHPSLSSSELCCLSVLNFTSCIFFPDCPITVRTHGLSFNLTFFGKKHFFKNSYNRILYHNYLNRSLRLCRNESSCVLHLFFSLDHTNGLELKLMMKLYRRFIISCWTSSRSSNSINKQLKKGATTSSVLFFYINFCNVKTIPENIIIFVPAFVDAKSIMAA